MQTCTNCGNSYTYSGFTCHGRRGIDPLCQQAYRTSILEQCDLSDDSDIDTTPADHTDSENDHDHPFFSDFDLPMPFEPHSDPNTSEHEEEPTTLHAACESDSDDDDDDDDDDDQSANTDALPSDAAVQALPELDEPVDRHDADGPMDDGNIDRRDDGQPNLHDIFVQRFTHGRAGMPVDGNGISADEQYQSTLTPKTPNDVYTPFASKLDWEFAKWAKTSGISSTAITNLLKIEGVRPAVHLKGIAMTRCQCPH